MKIIDPEKLDPREFIIIKGARVNNLKNLTVAIPRNKLVVITGLSGSGKSSLAFDTLYADGQRRYVESLSSYARQFLGRMSKPEVDYIKGISPAIAIEQKVNTRNPRSTVGTSTEIYEYLKLLFARIGVTYSPVSGKQVKRHSVTDVVEAILQKTDDTRVVISTPVISKTGRTIKDQLTIALQQGFTRMLIGQEMFRIDEVLKCDKAIKAKVDFYILIDRFVVQHVDDELQARIADSAQTAFYEGEGSCLVEFSNEQSKELVKFSNRFERDGISFEEPSVNLFSFNNPFGACKTCEGFGNVIGIDEDLVVPDKSLSIYQDAVACWRGEKMSEYKNKLVMVAYKFDFPIHRPYFELSEKERELLWSGNKHFEGLTAFFNYIESQHHKIQYRVMLSRYRGKTLCPDCKGTRLRKDAGYVKIGGKSISNLVVMPISGVLTFFKELKLNEYDLHVASRLIIEIRNRLQFLSDVGLGYLTLNRLSNSLSGGESQRINLATSLGSSLVGSMYILDEPSIGLHPRDTQLLIKVLKQLRDLGNTVIVVEHDEEIIRAADQVIDIGPLAGSHGGELIFQGNFEELLHDTKSLTAAYVSGRESIEVPILRRKWKDFITVSGARENNLHNITVQFPLNTLNVVTGVSGSGKTSLVKQILYPALMKFYGEYGAHSGKYDKLTGDYQRIGSVEMIDQNPIGRSSRSNPATYVKAFDDIRNLFADQALSRTRGYKPGYFSFNIDGGRCEECEGDGTVTIEMQFMADIHLVCESCHGKRFKDEILDVKVNGLHIAEILSLTVDEAIDFFGSGHMDSTIGHRITSKLKPLADVGLGYLKLGQSSDTLSGGEAQRIKLAFFLSKGISESPTLFIFDEPTTGLHFHDISKLLTAFAELINKGHSLIVIEHNPDVIKCADWVIDLGPDGGDKGGNLVFAGTPEDLAKCKTSVTGHFIKSKLTNKS
ncbi:MAG TPA: excinuclease ABC subunit UvrA [Bacteroidales bacterium]